MSNTNTAAGCGCGGRPKYNIFLACSGAADVGNIADKAARELVKEKRGMMSCIAAIAAGIEDITDKTKAAAQTFVIDGCDKECAKKIMEKNGIKDFHYVKVTDCGMEKGKTAVAEENIKIIADKAKAMLE